MRLDLVPDARTRDRKRALSDPLLQELKRRTPAEIDTLIAGLNLNNPLEVRRALAALAKAVAVLMKGAT